MKEQANKSEKNNVKVPPRLPDTRSTEQDDNLPDPESEISEQDMQDLEDAGSDRSSDESQSADMLDNEDNEGVALNEGPDDDDLFDTGEDLDISKEALFPDEDPDSEDN